MRIWIVVLMLIVGGPLYFSNASAASFDCAKASSIFEYAICQSDELSSLDENMAAAYKLARSKVSRVAAGEILDGQRRWHEYAQKVCIQDMLYPNADYNEEGIFCLQQVFINRVERLERVGAKDGVVVYSLDDYIALYTDEPDEWSRIADHVVSVQQVDSDNPSALAFNQVLRAKSFLDAEAEIDTTSSSELTLQITAATPRRFSVEELYYQYGHGAAHGNYNISYVHFLRREGRELRANDLFVGTDWAQSIRPQIVKSLADQLGEDGLWEELTELEATIVNPAFWALSAEGFSVQFQPYEVAAYAAGAPVATLSWDVMTPYMTPGAKRIIGSR